MKLPLISTLLTFALLPLISTQARAQTADPLAEAKQLGPKCLEFYNAGKYDEAIETCQRVLAISEKILGEHSGVATDINNLALAYQAKGDYTKAEQLYQRALGMYEKIFGVEDTHVATTLNNLALVYYSKGDYEKAEQFFQRALAIRETVLGNEHPDVATSLNSFAGLYQAQGDYVKAEHLFQRALAIREKVFGSEHLAVAIVLNNLAQLYSDKGDDTKAEPLFLRALDIFKKLLNEEHPLTANLLNNLALLSMSKGDFTRAESLMLRIIKIREKVLGNEHPDLAASLNNLAGLYSSMDDYARAEPLYQRALEIYEKAFGSEHPNVATALQNLGGVYESKGNYEKAEQLYQRALSIREKMLGGEHPFVADTLYHLAGLYDAKEDYPHAFDFLLRAQEARESNINAILSTGSERQKQLYLNKQSGETDLVISHAYLVQANTQAARLALTTIIRRKGRALDAMTDQIAGLRRRAAPDDVKLLDALATAQSQLANLQLSNDARLSPADRKKRVTELEAQIERLQNDIGRRNAEFRARTQPITLDAVRAAIPTDAALVEIFAYQPYNMKAKASAERFGTARYVAYVLKPQSDVPQLVDLGETAAIDADLKLWRAALLDPDREDVRALGRKVDERVMRPIRKLLGTTKRLFISPDGALNLIPFAALVDENNKYLMETYSLDYLTSGRDLLRLQVSSENKPGAYIFANPTYNLTGQSIAACGRPKRKRGLTLDTANAAAASDTDATATRGVEYRGIDFTKACYPPLRGTAQEATLINAALPNATVLTDKQATEAALKQLNAPPILHIATHGFFLPDQPQALNIDAAQNARAASTENPLLRSGLIMAGANQKSSGTNEDGVLTAAEAAGLNLWGTKLVVLSACETGLGDVVNGAGVYGLRRALVLAGSETQVMSLWQVDDAATRDLMADYYTRLQRNEGRTEAMRQAQLAMLRGETGSRARGTRTPSRAAAANAANAHPFYWAAFISSGDWRSMNGKEQ